LGARLPVGESDGVVISRLASHGREVPLMGKPSAQARQHHRGLRPMPPAICTGRHRVQARCSGGCSGGRRRAGGSARQKWRSGSGFRRQPGDHAEWHSHHHQLAGRNTLAKRCDQVAFRRRGPHHDAIRQIYFANQNVNGGVLTEGELASIPKAPTVLALNVVIFGRERRRLKSLWQTKLLPR